MSSTNTVESYFQVEQKTDKQHILDNPDTYIGSVEHIDSKMWILDSDTNIVEKNITYIPGLFKLFDEGIVNCRDHYVRMLGNIQAERPNSLPVTYIHVSISEDGTITLTNDGNGIDVIQNDNGIWIPELIFAHLRTSTNYNKEERKIVGGKNGFGFKLVLIWSTYGRIETVDHIRQKRYIQEYRNNLDIIGEPQITKVAKSVKPYTTVTFKPDYARLGITNLDADMISLLKKRVYDICAITDASIQVQINGSKIPIKTFDKYVNLYIGSNTKESPRIHESNGERWEYIVAKSPNHEFMQVSFVNGIYTSKGGKHVDYILNQITKKIVEHIETKKKVKVTQASIKEQLMLFVRCDIENPAFDSQTKDYMNTPVSKFGSSCEVSDKFIQDIVKKLGVMEVACAINSAKETKDAKKTDGTKSTTVKGIPKLDDANWAGTARSKECMIIFCEGDSAKTGVISGLTAKDRDIIGVYPLKGKIMNIRGENAKKISENKEIADIKKILGLETNREYKTIEDVHKYLRYSKVVFITDQDLDGSHIKGLCINLFHYQWSSLTEIPGFISFMNTPIIKATKAKQVINFYNEGEYREWQSNTNTRGYTIKYYKGLGTSSKPEFLEYMRERKLVGFAHSGEETNNSIDMVFNKKRSDDRKHWLENVYNRDNYLDTRNTIIPFEEFINRELIHFSKYDCDRSIPNLMDGLKISLRKILFSTFKKNLTTEIKVAQLSGYVSEHSCYHHGEESLNKAIVGMAQNFMGSNNINLLYPSGQFGSRIEGGQDASSPRYIFTRLEVLTRLIFLKDDDHILNYLNDDGTMVEPQFYVPIIPTILVNGTKGIGTGFSTEILCYHPNTIINYLKHKLLGELTNHIDFIPYYEGFRGSITRITPTKYLFRGIYVHVPNKSDTIQVTELPVGFWTNDFKELLSNLQNDKDSEGKKIIPIIQHVKENYTDDTIDFEITFSKGKLAELEATKGEHGCNGLEKLLKLYNTSSTTNMNLFDANDNLKKYESVPDIIDDYFGTRLHYYQLRKDHLIKTLERELVVLSNKARFIQEILDETIDLRRKTKEVNIRILIDKCYAIIDEDDEYKYLLKMPMDSVSKENVDKLMKEHQDKSEELTIIQHRTIQQMWLNDLYILEEAYAAFISNKYTGAAATTQNDSERPNVTIRRKPPVSKAIAAKPNKKINKVIIDSDSDSE